MAGRGDEAPGDDWWSLLDPRANVRALGDVQAQALRAAGDLVERLARAVDGPDSDRDTDAGESGAREADDGARPGDAARLVDVWLELLGRIARAFDGSAPFGSDRDGRVDVDLHDGRGGRLRLVASRPDCTASTEVWLHNRSATAVPALGLHTVDLRSPGGVPLDATVTFDPSRIAEMPARSSRGVTVNVSVDPRSCPGKYRGVVQVDGAPDAWIALELVVGADGSQP